MKHASCLRLAISIPTAITIGTSPTTVEAGRVPDVRESSTALCVKRGGLFVPHNLLMRGHSRSGAAVFPTKPTCFKERDAAPAPSRLNPTPRPRDEGDITLQGATDGSDWRRGAAGPLTHAEHARRACSAGPGGTCAARRHRACA